MNNVCPHCGYSPLKDAESADCVCPSCNLVVLVCNYRVEYYYDDGGMTVARYPALGLMYWIMHFDDQITTCNMGEVTSIAREIILEKWGVEIPCCTGTFNERSVFILKWLRRHGDISKLFIKEEEVC